MVAVALAGAVTVAGLTRQTGGEVKFDGDTWQLRATVPLKLLTVPTVILEDDTPPGATASGANGAACRVKFAWAEASDGNVNNAVNRHRAGITARIFRLDWDNLDCDSDFNMSRFRFK